MFCGPNMAGSVTLFLHQFLHHIVLRINTCGISVLQEWQKCFEGKHVLRTEHGGKRYPVLTPVPSSYNFGIQLINSFGIYKRNTVNNTGYLKSTTRWVPNVIICCDIAYIRALSECYKCAIKY